MNNDNGYERALEIIREANKNRPIVACCNPTGTTGPTGATGPTGPAGEDGDDAETPTLTIGTITTGAPGTDASASIAGTAPNYVLNLTIPQGPTVPTA